MGKQAGTWVPCHPRSVGREFPKAKLRPEPLIPAWINHRSSLPRSSSARPKKPCIPVSEATSDGLNHTISADGGWGLPGPPDELSLKQQGNRPKMGPTRHTVLGT